MMPKTTRSDAVAGAVGAALALGVSELAAGLLGLPSLIEGLGNWVIDVVPTPIKDWAIATFGTYDQPTLLIGIALVTILIGAGVGLDLAVIPACPRAAGGSGCSPGMPRRGPI